MPVATLNIRKPFVQPQCYLPSLCSPFLHSALCKINLLSHQLTGSIALCSAISAPAQNDTHSLV